MNRNDDARPWAVSDGTALDRMSRLARANRSSPTEAERLLWRHLRRIEVDGSHFRRQVVIAGYIADFACARVKLVIEVDGGQHCESARDLHRTAALEAQGWSVLRFWNNEVMQNLEGVADRVAEALASAAGARPCATPTPNPSPQGGGELRAPAASRTG